MNLRQVDGVKKFLRNPTRSDSTPADEGSGLTGSPVLVTYAPVPELGWSVILEEPLDAALANVEILKALSAGVPGGGSVRRSRYHCLGQPKDY